MFDWLTTAAAWWGGTALGGGAVLLIGCVLMRFTREPATRQRIGEIAVVAALLVAVLRLGPTWLALPSFASTANAAAVPNTLPSDLNSWVVLAPTPDAGGEPITWSTEPQTSVSEAPVPWDWTAIAKTVTAIYLSIVGLLLTRWLLGQWALARLRRMARPASARSRSLFAMMAGGAIWPRPRLGLTERLRLPVAFGLRRPAVLLPDSFDQQADETTLRWVFAHELTHLRRRDPWSYWAMGLAQAVYFYVPWFWWVKRHVRLCQEYIADAAAAREGAAADEYAQFLVSLAKGPATPLGAAGLGSSSDLFRRVNMLLQTSRGPSVGSRSSVGLPAIGLMVAAILASGLGVRAEPPAEKRAWSDLADKVIVLDGMQGVEFQPMILKLDDEDQDAKKDDAKKEKEKSDKKRVIIVQQDGKNIVTIPADADAEEVKRLIEKAMSAAKKQTEAAAKQADAARKAEIAAREKAKQAAEKARRRADDSRQEVEKELKAAEKARKEAVEKMEKANEGRAKFAEEKAKVAEGRAKIATGGDMRLGVQLEKLSSAMADQLNLSSDSGLLIVGVVDDSPASKAGFKANDILVQFAGKAVSSDANEFIRRVREAKGDDAVDAVVLRKGKKERVRNIKLGEAKTGGGAAFRFVPSEKLDEFKKEGFKFEPKIMKDGKFEFKVEGMPKFDAKDFQFDIQLDGIPGIDGKKLGDEIKKSIELKLEPMKKKLDPKKLQEMQAEIELKLQPLREKIDPKKIEEIQQQIELKVQPMIKEKLEPKLKEVQRKIELQVEPLKKIDVKKLADMQKEIKELDGTIQRRFKEMNPTVDFIVVPDEKSGSGKKASKSSNVSVSVTVNDGEFKAVQKEEKLEITVIGTADGEKVKVSEIKIYADGEKANYSSVEDVPSKYRDKVKKLIANQEGSPVRFKFQRDEQ